ncbi:hypothetical protein EZS27_026290 [termite gut metagenome]|uniref:Uncharacterized protein n=1 Tax=termite gut metagenome TaxID=433724 RepID=A0A5J4QS52_9ZZZZ
MKHSIHTSTSAGTTSVSTSQLFPSEFTEFTNQLHDIYKWFEDYQKRNPQIDDVIHPHVVDIQNSITDVTYNIAELVDVEFRENTYYKDL